MLAEVQFLANNRMTVSQIELQNLPAKDDLLEFSMPDPRMAFREKKYYLLKVKSLCHSEERLIILCQEEEDACGSAYFWGIGGLGQFLKAVGYEASEEEQARLRTHFAICLHEWRDDTSRVSSHFGEIHSFFGFKGKHHASEVLRRYIMELYEQREKIKATGKS